MRPFHTAVIRYVFGFGLVLKVMIVVYRDYSYFSTQDWLFEGFLFALGLFVLVRTPVTFCRMQSASRLEKGECVKCGYDLRGITRASCPECGETISDSRGDAPAQT